MKNKLLKISFIIVPVFCIGVFLYMSYFNAAYDHPGRYVYKARCASCHGDNGEGTQALVPPIADADMLRDHLDSVPAWLIRGMNTPITVNGKPYEQTMYPIELSEVEMANLLNYLAKDMVHVNKLYKADSMLVIMKRLGQTGL